jgi:hypothetical protein
MPDKPKITEQEREHQRRLDQSNQQAIRQSLQNERRSAQRERVQQQRRDNSNRQANRQSNQSERRSTQREREHQRREDNRNRQANRQSNQNDSTKSTSEEQRNRWRQDNNNPQASGQLRSNDSATSTSGEPHQQRLDNSNPQAAGQLRSNDSATSTSGERHQRRLDNNNRQTDRQSRQIERAKSTSEQQRNQQRLDHSNRQADEQLRQVALRKQTNPHSLQQKSNEAQHKDLATLVAIPNQPETEISLDMLAHDVGNIIRPFADFTVGGALRNAQRVTGWNPEHILGRGLDNTIASLTRRTVDTYDGLQSAFQANVLGTAVTRVRPVESNGYAIQVRPEVAVWYGFLSNYLNSASHAMRDTLGSPFMLSIPGVGQMPTTLMHVNRVQRENAQNIIGRVQAAPAWVSNIRTRVQLGQGTEVLKDFIPSYRGIDGAYRAYSQGRYISAGRHLEQGAESVGNAVMAVIAVRSAPILVRGLAREASSAVRSVQGAAASARRASRVNINAFERKRSTPGRRNITSSPQRLDIEQTRTARQPEPGQRSSQTHADSSQGRQVSGQTRPGDLVVREVTSQLQANTNISRQGQSSAQMACRESTNAMTRRQTGRPERSLMHRSAASIRRARVVVGVISALSRQPHLSPKLMSGGSRPAITMQGRLVERSSPISTHDRSGYTSRAPARSTVGERAPEVQQAPSPRTPYENVPTRTQAENATRPANVGPVAERSPEPRVAAHPARSADAPPQSPHQAAGNIYHLADFRARRPSSSEGSSRQTAERPSRPRIGSDAVRPIESQPRTNHADVIPIDHARHRSTPHGIERSPDNSPHTEAVPAEIAWVQVGNGGWEQVQVDNSGLVSQQSSQRQVENAPRAMASTNSSNKAPTFNVMKNYPQDFWNPKMRSMVAKMPSELEILHDPEDIKSIQWLTRVELPELFATKDIIKSPGELAHSPLGLIYVPDIKQPFLLTVADKDVYNRILANQKILPGAVRLGPPPLHDVDDRLFPRSHVERRGLSFVLSTGKKYGITDTSARTCPPCARYWNNIKNPGVLNFPHLNHRYWSDFWKLCGLASTEYIPHRWPASWDKKLKNYQRVAEILTITE